MGLLGMVKAYRMVGVALTARRDTSLPPPLSVHLYQPLGHRVGVETVAYTLMQGQDQIVALVAGEGRGRASVRGQ